MSSDNAILHKKNPCNETAVLILTRSCKTRITRVLKKDSYYRKEDEPGHVLHLGTNCIDWEVLQVLRRKKWFGNADVCRWKVSCTLWITSGISHGPYGVWCKSCCGWPSQESTPEANCCDSFHQISESCWTSHLSCFTASQSCLSLGQGLPLAPSSDRGAGINVSLKFMVQ